MSSAICFNLEQSNILLSGYGLMLSSNSLNSETSEILSSDKEINFNSLSNDKNFRLVQIESICKKQLLLK